MTVPGRPLPSVGLLLRCLAGGHLPDAAHALGSGRSVHWYPNGTHALAAGVEAVVRTAGARTATFWAPAYFCDPALALVRRLPVSIRFYPITETLEPDWPQIAAMLLRTSDPQIFLLVHYFGFPSASEAAGAFCARHGFVLFEDAAHVLRPTVSAAADLLLMCPHKLLAVPDLGVLLVSERVAGALPPARSDPNWSDTVSWLGAGLIKQLLIRLRVPWHRVTQGRPRDASARHPSTPSGEAMRPLAVRLFSAMVRDMEGYAGRRRRHYGRLLEWTRGHDHLEPLFPLLPPGVCPWTCPLLVAGGARPLAQRLHRCGVPTFQWWEIPPEVSADARRHRGAMALYARLIFLPVHQGLSDEQIDFIGQTLHAMGSLNTARRVRHAAAPASAGPASGR